MILLANRDEFFVSNNDAAVSKNDLCGDEIIDLEAESQAITTGLIGNSSIGIYDTSQRGRFAAR
jgi:hypothetical protein